MKMYPVNQTLRMDGEDVQWPGVDENGKFTNGDFNDPTKPPSMIPAETLNLLLDNVGGFVESLGKEPNNTDGNQMADAFASYMARKVPLELERNSRGKGVGHAFGGERFLIFDFSDGNHRSLKIKAGTHIRLDITDAATGAKETRWLDVESDTTYNFHQGIIDCVAKSQSRAGEQDREGGRNIYVYLAPDGADGVKLVVSCNSTFPNDVSEAYTANNTRKIGQFHTLCAAAGNDLKGQVAEVPSSGIKRNQKVLVKQYADADGFREFYTCNVEEDAKVGTYYDVVTVRHPLAGFRVGDILPESVWCLTFRPTCNPDGMAYDIDTDTAVDIYLQSGKGSATASEYKGTVTNNRQHPNHQDDLRRVGKRLLYDHEFSSMALGSNECTNIKNSANPTTTGGHLDTADRRMVSFIGIEDACGVFWQWLSDVAALGYGAAYGNTKTPDETRNGHAFTGGYVGGVVTNTNPGQLSNVTWRDFDGQDAFGSMYCVSSALLAGGYWNNSVYCGSRARNASSARSLVGSSYVGRGASRIARKA